MREAAVVLSCCPPGRFTPLIVVKPAPVLEDEYCALYAAYVEARDKRDELVEFQLARHNSAAATSDVIKAANADVDAAAEMLTPYRSWWRHQRMVAALLAKCPPECGLLLFDPALGDLDQLEAVPVSRIGHTREKLLPQRTKLARLSTGSLTKLLENAWRACGREGTVPQGVGVGDDGPEAWLAAVARSLRTGQPIRLGASSDTTPLERADATEAVLIEVSDNAELLLGVQYAQVRGAELVLAPDPPLGAIQTAVAAMQDVANSKLLAGIKDYLFGDPAVSKGLRRIEAAVNAAVPDAVVAKVGARALSAFTTGLPYTFVRRRGQDWSRKPIGHVSGDAALLVLTEMLGAPDDGEVGFSLVFDPGFFDTAETKNVLALLHGRVAHPVILDGLAANSQALIRLAALPLDVIYFNTHGSNREILLADGPLPAFKVQSRLRLQSHPFVFNSSCLSWVGVGREFLRTGARAYTGTLWSVNAQHASDYARIVLDRVTREGLPLAHAMRKTGVDRATELAYIHAGTVSSGLTAAPDELRNAAQADIPRRITRAARILLDQLDNTSGLVVSWFDDALDCSLWAEANSLIAEYARRVPQRDADWLEAIAAQLRVISQWGNLAARAPAQLEFARGYIQGVTAERIRRSPGQKARLIEEGKAQLQTLVSWTQRRIDLLYAGPALYEEARRVLDGLVLEDAARNALCAQLTLQAGCIHSALNHHSHAVALLTESSARAGEHQVPALLALCDVLKRDRRPAEALDAAVRARDAAGQGNHLSVRAIGWVTQLKLACGDAEGALANAREGYALATELDDTGERAAFKGDEARALLHLRRFLEAEEAAHQHRTLATRSHNQEAVASACGLLAEVLIGLGKTAEALSLVDEGLASATRLGFKREQGNFLLDRNVLRKRMGDHRGAMQDALGAAELFMDLRDMGQVREAFGRAANSFNEFGRAAPSGEWVDALCSKATVELEALTRVSSDLQLAILNEAIVRFSHIVELGPNGATTARIVELADRAETMLAEPGSAALKPLLIVTRAYRTFERLAHGDRLGARAPAMEADALTDGSARLIALVDRFG